MWSSIENFKENLNRIALEIHDDEDDEEELSVHSSGDPPENNSISDRRISRSFGRSKSPTYHSPIANGFGSAHNPEIEKYKIEIKRLKESEAEIKALSVNYAALLKEKEDQISRLNEENGSLKQSLQSSSSLSASRNMHKGSNDQSPNRQSKAIVNRSFGSRANNGFSLKQDGLSNGTSFGNEKELADLLEEKNKSLSAMQASHELQLKKLEMELNKERTELANMQTRLQEEQKLSSTFQQELNSLKVDKDKMAVEMTNIRAELSHKVSELKQLQMELHERDNDESNEAIDGLRRVIETLQKENSHLKNEKDKLEASAAGASSADRSNINGLTEVHPLEVFPEKEEMKRSLQNLENELKETRRERDKALQELKRLKQHLLEKEMEESEKMDEDSQIIEELRQNIEYQRAQILQLEKAIKQAIASQEDVKTLNDNELKKSKDTVNELNKKLANCLSTIEAQNVEVLNLQTALGQYYAEIEAKERVGEELVAAKEESHKLSGLLKDAYNESETFKKEKEEMLVKFSDMERRLSEGKGRINKLEQDNEKLRRALEQSMTRLNRMSLDSDNYVDRRIVIKLLVTYFQRNHSKEVLDLMVRMLGFSDEDKQRIGMAQQGSGKGVVRGVLGLPGRLVGGILGGSSAPSSTASDQSFADLWVDFLLKETEREKREAAEAGNGNAGDQIKGFQEAMGADGTMAEHRSNSSDVTFISPRQQSSPKHNLPPLAPHSRQVILPPEHSDAEFSTVPLTPLETNYQISRLPRY
ncbi:golgin candidate 4 isoform X2 [Nicotiana sylvestris]|uniref:Golgin candidate 4-like isoform X2 n=1 Tax=Nicotiana sylvestris TaxID=4096 RepID=A0A1U7VKV1_NICSY|nr:PREDICTED: golgin candidate 4-like isoform X2 [Nicotiana sylvestris]XP_016467442.1 PREDICTED: golgin candidate 4-like isoform X2 [Nicotiana tabacum]